MDRTKEFWSDIANRSNSFRQAGKLANVDGTTAQKYIKKFKLKLKGKPKNAPKNFDIDKVVENIKTFGSLRACARYMNCEPQVISKILDKHKIDYRTLIQDYQDIIAPDLRKNILKVDSKNGIIISADYHSPFNSNLWLDRMLKLAKKRDINRLVIGGDFCDFDRLSWWVKRSNSEDLAVPLEKELSYTENILERLDEVFDEIYFLGGNHWLRLMQNITFSISMRRLMGLLDRKDNNNYHFSENYQWLLIDNRLRVTHPFKSRKLDGTLARDIGILHPDQIMIIAHRHRYFSGFTPDGRPSVELGWMGDVNRMQYVQHVDSSYYNWVNGFCVWQDNVLENLCEYNYNWKNL